MRLVRDEHGSTTVLAACVIAALLVVTVLVVYLGSAVLARHRAQSGADLAALAAASSHVLGGIDPCAVARTLAPEQDPPVAVLSCSIEGIDVIVRTVVRVRMGVFGTSEAHAVARAGPVE